MQNLRKLIRRILLESLRFEKDLITEPDGVEGREEETEKEVSAGGVPGVSVPLGAGPTYPASRKRKKKTKK